MSIATLSRSEPLPATMRAITCDQYGSFELQVVPRPECAASEVLVRVHASSVNVFDGHMLTGTPFLVRMERGWGAPKDRRLGTDLAGTVVAVGPGVERFSVGDQVFGTSDGSYAEYACTTEDRLAHKPSNVSFEDAAAMPVGALTAVQALRDQGGVVAGQHVLVHGASGAVGTYAIQLAKHLGAEVTGVCSSRNVELVRSLGADHVVDYTSADFTADADRYDLIVDIAGTRSARGCKRCLKPGGMLVMVGGPKNLLFGPLWHVVNMLVAFRFGGYRAAFFIAEANAADFELFAELVWTGALRTVTDSVVTLEDLAQGFETMKSGRARGKIVVRI